MTKHAWKLKDYGFDCEASEISDDMNKLVSDGWEVHQSMSIPEFYEVSRRLNLVSGLNYEDSVAMRSTLRVMLRR
jgi:hypothetical protein